MKHSTRALMTSMLVITALCRTTASRCQLHTSEGKLQFLENGQPVALPGAWVYGHEPTIVPVQADATLSAAEKAQLLAALAANLDHTLRNLEDPNLHLDVLYDAIWGSGFYVNYKAELQQLRKALDLHVAGIMAGTYTFGAHKYFPAAHLQDLFNSPGPAYTIENGRSNNVQKEYNVLHRDPYKNWIVGLYNNDPNLKAVTDLQQDAKYLQGWRDIEALYKALKLQADSFSRRINNAYDCSGEGIWAAQTDQDYAALQNNEVITRLKLPFYAGWLWYTEGIPVLNPFFATGPEKEYPIAHEETAFLNSPAIHQTDSLSKAHTESLSYTTATANVLKFPYATGDERIVLWHYDASANYQSPDLDLHKRRLTADNDVYLAIHNLPADRNLVITTDTSFALPEYSQGITDLYSGIGGAARFINSFSGISTAFGSFISLFQNTSRSIPLQPINLPGNPAHAVNYTYTSTRANGRINIFSQRLGSKLAKTSIARYAVAPKTVTTNAQKAAFITKAHTDEKLAEAFSITGADNQSIPASLEKLKVFIRKALQVEDELPFFLTDNWVTDKPLVLAQYLAMARDKEGKPIRVSKDLADAFLDNNRKNWVVDYTNEADVARGIEMLLQDFTVFYNSIVSCNDFYTKRLVVLKDQLSICTQLVKIPTRNLPPDNLAQKTSTTPQMRTELVLLPLRTNKKTQLTISEEKLTGKKDTTVVYKDAFKTGKWMRFDVSAGIGYTYRAYNNNTLVKEDNPGDVDNLNQQVHGIAGVHWYPWKIYKRESSFCLSSPDVFLHRISVFAGFDILKPTYNFYPGLSIDLWPGLKLINGYQLYRHVKYEVVSNQVVDRHQGLEPAGFFTSLHIDVSVFKNIFTQ